MNVSRRICAFASFSFSSIFDVSIFFDADVVDDLDALPLLHVVGDELADDAVRERVVADLDRQVVEEVGVPQPLEVVAGSIFSVASSYGTQMPCDGALGFSWM